MDGKEWNLWTVVSYSANEKLTYKSQSFFRKNLRGLRQNKESLQHELASQKELDRSYIGGIERGERNISLFSILKPAKACKYLHQSC